LNFNSSKICIYLVLFGYIKHIHNLTQLLKKNLTGTVTWKFVFYRDLRPKRLRNTGLKIWVIAVDLYRGKTSNIQFRQKNNQGPHTAAYLPVRKDGPGSVAIYIRFESLHQTWPNDVPQAPNVPPQSYCGNVSNFFINVLAF